MSSQSQCLLLSFLCASVAACSGGGGGNSSMTPDAGATADADTTPQPDGNTAPIACTTVADFADLGTIDGAVVANAANGYLSIDSVLDVGPPQDLFLVELFGGFGVMTDGLKTGSFPLTGAETDFNTCGVCVTVIADFEPGVGSPMTYVAQSGTVNITSIEGNFTGTFVPDGATTLMVGASFDENTEMFEPRTDCTIAGAGAAWDKAIPAAPAP